jgi:hypothetical protein
MRPGAIKIRTRGSNWWIDENANEYMRLPLEETTRENPEWGGPEAGPLQDGVWHPYFDWTLAVHPHDLSVSVLMAGFASGLGAPLDLVPSPVLSLKIRISDTGECLWGPEAHIEGRT